MRQAAGAVIALSGGLAVSFATAAFILALGIVPRAAAISGTKRKILWYETVVMCGIFTGLLLELGAIRAGLPTGFLALAGLLGGIFTGCWSCALGELLNMYAVLLRRLKIRILLPLIIGALCLGKTVGALLGFLT